MIVSQLDQRGDWRFGRSLGNYAQRSEAIAQNVKTRLRSFTDDWYLDTSANIDWLGLLGNRNVQARVRREVERVTLATDGVLRITELDIDVQSRAATILLSYVDVYEQPQREAIKI